LDLIATINHGPTRDDGLSAAIDLAVEQTEEYSYWAQVQNLLRDSNHGV
jgi:hypothetical protein